MKKYILILFSFFTVAVSSQAQEMQTLFRQSGPSGGYGALSNKFTTLRGEYANVAEVYGGWFIKKKFLLGLGAAATTNNLRVPVEFSTAPDLNMSWQYGQFGLMTEYVIGSNRLLHFNLTLFSGAGFTVQYERTKWDEDVDHRRHLDHDENFFYVLEPGAQVEINLLRWLRLSPGVSYRKTFGSEGIGLRDEDLSDWSYNITLKIGKF